MYAIGGWAVDILYVTERAVFVLGEDGPLLVEVAPGWTAEQVTALMDFRPSSRSTYGRCRPCCSTDPAGRQPQIPLHRITTPKV